MLSLFACATLFFFIVSLRKNRALQTCLFILTFSLFFAAIGEYEDVCKKIAGWGYMATDCQRGVGLCRHTWHRACFESQAWGKLRRHLPVRQGPELRLRESRWNSFHVARGCPELRNCLREGFFCTRQ